MSSAFTPQSFPRWPSKRAVLLVHGIGDASVGSDGAFPVDAFKTVLGNDAGNLALYTLNYDFINDWMADKTAIASGVAILKAAIANKFGDDDLATTIGEYAGDVLWPVLSGSIRLAVRDAFVAQLQQIHLDRNASALSHDDDPLTHQVSIIAHSLGCFHTYEVLCATASDPQYRLLPGTHHAQFRSVVLMASPVQLIRSIANDIRPVVPDIGTLATMSKPLGIPAEVAHGRRTASARQFVSVVGNHDPVGGFLLGKKKEFAFMELPGQESVIDAQTVMGLDQKAALKAALHNRAEGGGAHAGATGALGAGVSLSNPHSWVAYIERHEDLLRGALLS